MENKLGSVKTRGFSKSNDLFKSLDELKPLSAILLEIESILNDPYANVNELSNLISVDQALVSKILRIVNSSFYGFEHKISTIKHAVTVMGFNAIRNVVLTSHVFDAFPVSDTIIFDKKLFWKHSIATASAARVIAKMLNIASFEEVFFGGVLHDVGKLLIAKNCASILRDINFLVVCKNMPLIYAEQAVLDTDHAQIGKVMAKKWRFPYLLADVIATHHEPKESKGYFKESACVKLGDFFSNAFCFGFRGDDKITYIEPEIWGLLNYAGVSKNDAIYKIFNEMMNSVSFLESLIG